MRLFQMPGSVLVESETRWFRLQGETWDSVINRDDLNGWVTGQIADGTLIDGTPDLATLLPPIGSQEVWAAGVTYYRSRTARMEEAKLAGGGDFYDRVYDAARPELFFKATPHRVRGHRQPVRIRKRLEVERARAGARAGRQLARRDCRLHDRQRHELARHRGRESVVPAAGQGLRRQLRAGSVRADRVGSAPCRDRGASGDSTRRPKRVRGFDDTVFDEAGAEGIGRVLCSATTAFLMDACCSPVPASCRPMLLRSPRATRSPSPSSQSGR